MKPIKKYAQEMVQAVAHGAQPYQARLDVLQGVELDAYETAELNMQFDNGCTDHMRDLRLTAEVLYRHVMRLDGGACIAKSKDMFELLIDRKV